MMKQEKFSIRKTHRGAVSARIATIGLLALTGTTLGYEVQADSSLPAPESSLVSHSFGETCSVDKEGVTTEELQAAESNLLLAETAVIQAQVNHQRAEEAKQAAQLLVDQQTDQLAGLPVPSASAIDQANKDLVDSQAQVGELIKEVEALTRGVNEATAAVDQAQEAAIQALDAFREAQGETQARQAQYDKIAQEASEATPEAIQEAKELVSNKDAELGRAQERQVQEATNEQATLEERDRQAGVVETAQKRLSDAENQLNDAVTAVNEAEAEEGVSQQNLGELRRQLNQKNEAVTEARTAVEQASTAAEQAQKDYDELVASNKQTLKELEKALSDAGPETLTEIQEFTLEERPVTEEDTQSVALGEGERTRTGSSLANETVQFSGEAVEKIIVNRQDFNALSEVDLQVIYDRLASLDYRKLSEYARAYLMELRRLNGIDIPVPEVTDKALAWAKARSEEMARNNVLSHDTLLEVRDYGLTNQTENAESMTLGGVLSRSTERMVDWFGNVISSQTLYSIPYADEKELAYHLILDYFHDYRNVSPATDEFDVGNYGHRVPLLAASGDGFAVVRANNSDQREYGTMSFVTEGADGDPYAGVYSNDFEIRNADQDALRTEFYYHGKRIVFLPKTTFVYVAQEEVEVPNQDHVAAFKALNDFKERIRLTEESALRVLDEKKQVRDDAQVRFDGLETERQELDGRLASLAEETVRLTRVLEQARERKITADQQLSLAQTDLEKDEQDLQKLSERYRQAQQQTAEATEGVTSARADLDQAQKRLMQLETLDQEHQDADENLNQAKQVEENLKNQSDSAQATLERLRAEKVQEEEGQRQRQQDLETARQMTAKAQEVLDTLLQERDAIEKVQTALEAAQNALNEATLKLEFAQKELASRRQVRDAQQALLDCLKNLPVKDSGSDEDVVPQDPTGSDEDPAPQDPTGSDGDVVPQDPTESDEDPAPQDPIGSDEDVVPQDPTGSDEGPAPQDPTGSDGDVVPQDPTGSDEDPAPQDPTGSDEDVVPQDPTGLDEDPAPQDPTGSDEDVVPQDPTGSDEGPAPQDPTGSDEDVVPQDPTDSDDIKNQNKNLTDSKRPSTSSLNPVVSSETVSRGVTNCQSDSRQGQVAGKTLPKTGEVVSILGVIGLAVCGLALLELNRRRH